MYRFNIIIIIVLSSLAAQSCSCVNARDNDERVHIHLDKQVYVAGETVRYKAYLTNAGSAVLCSRILYFNLTGPGPDNQLSWRINIDSNSVAGSLVIPEYMKPGMYVFTAYTNWMRNNPSTYFSERILVLSLIEDNNSGLTIFKQSLDPRRQKSYANPENQEGLNLIPAKNEYHQLEVVKFELEFGNIKAAGADLSVSVNMVSPFDSLLNDLAMPEVRSYKNRDRCLHKVEDRGFILSGRVIRNTDIPLTRCGVWLAVADSVTPGVLYTGVDSTGEFRFFLNRTYDNRELIIQMADLSAAAGCRLEISGKTDQMADTGTITYHLNAQELDYLNNVKSIRLVEAVYGIGEKILPPEGYKKRSVFLNVPNRVVVPAEYSEMGNFREIASNIIPEIRFGNRRDKLYLEIMSPNTNTWKSNDMVFLNGVPFADLGYISTLGSKEIQRIEVIRPNILVGDITLPGLVSVYTYDHGIPESYLSGHTIRFMNKVEPVNSGTELSEGNDIKKEDHFPDLRNSLYWNPFVKVTEGNKGVIEFPSTLLTGKFMIKAEGITIDGIPLTANGYFTIKKK